jgi:hypothetical protein
MGILMKSRRIAAALGLAIMLIGRRHPAQGQNAPQPPRSRLPTRVPVTVVLDSTETVARFGILRHVDQRPLDVIVLYGSVDATTLSDAVHSLLIVRAAQGDTARRDGMVRIRGIDPAQVRPSPHYPWAERVVNDLRRAPIQGVTGVGNFRAVEIWLPPQGVRRLRQRSPIIPG